jgi:hypothetical protein
VLVRRIGIIAVSGASIDFNIARMAMAVTPESDSLADNPNLQGNYALPFTGSNWTLCI